MNTKIYIDPRSVINYASFYIEGLYDVFGKKNVRFSAKYFSDLHEIDILMAFVAVSDNATRRFIVDYRDPNNIINDAYRWADVYAKINMNEDTLPEDMPDNKLICIPPSFAISIWNPCELLCHLMGNFVKAGIIKHGNDKNIHLRPPRWIRYYLSLLRRPKLSYYANRANEGTNRANEGANRGMNYIFFVSTFWQDCDETNSFRQHYMSSCYAHPDVDFYGGFFVKKGDPVPEDIPAELVFSRYVPNHIYLENIKKSVLVFNTPAVADCHGWKLGEFLCLGKAIISTGLANELPEPLEHCKNIYWVGDEKEIGEAIDNLLKNGDLRLQLEKNAKEYYNRYVSPEKVIERITDVQTAINT
jgi:glycosyltransferase involved in cell wall biosynthesis